MCSLYLHFGVVVMAKKQFGRRGQTQRNAGPNNHSRAPNNPGDAVAHDGLANNSRLSGIGFAALGWLSSVVAKLLVAFSGANYARSKLDGIEMYSTVLGAGLVGLLAYLVFAAMVIYMLFNFRQTRKIRWYLGGVIMGFATPVAVFA